jgi:hypothetical protein
MEGEEKLRAFPPAGRAHYRRKLAPFDFGGNYFGLLSRQSGRPAVKVT